MADTEETGAERDAEAEEDVEPAYDIETYRHAIVDARRTLDQQLRAFNDVTDKAWRIVQLNGLIATIYIAAVANALNDITFSGLAIAIVAIGFVIMIYSVYLASEGQEAKTVTIGLGSDGLRSVRETDPDEITYIYQTVKQYEQWIDEVNDKTEKNADAVNTAKWTLLVGIGFIIGGAIIALVT